MTLSMLDALRNLTIALAALAIVFGTSGADGRTFSEAWSKYKVVLLDLENDVGTKFTDVYEKTLQEIGLQVVRVPTTDTERPDKLLATHRADLIISGKYDASIKEIATVFHGKTDESAALVFPSGPFRVLPINDGKNLWPLFHANIASAVAQKLTPETDIESWLLAVRYYYENMRQLDTCRPRFDGFDQMLFAGDLIWPDQSQCNPSILFEIAKLMGPVLSNLPSDGGKYSAWIIHKDMTGTIATLYKRTGEPGFLDALRQLRDLDLPNLGERRNVLPTRLAAAYFAASLGDDRRDIDAAAALALEHEPIVYQYEDEINRLRYMMAVFNIRKFLPPNDARLGSIVKFDADDINRSLETISVGGQKNLKILARYNISKHEACSKSSAPDPVLVDLLSSVDADELADDLGSVPDSCK